jgi:hypothetical protein
VEPAITVAEDDTEARRQTMLQKLEYLVARSGRNAFGRLLELRSDFWSFVDISNGGIE